MMNVLHCLVSCVGAAEEHGVFVQEPAGQAPELPLAADVGTGPEDGEHVLLADHLDKPAHHRHHRHRALVKYL